MILFSTPFIAQLKRFSGLILLFVILLINAIFLNFNAFRTFYFLDLSTFLDATWRIYIGQKPYIDFISYCGMIHFYMVALFFHLFGFGKIALLAHLITISSLVITATYLIAKKGNLPTHLAALLALLTMTSFYWPISHPWYNQSAHFWGLLAVTFFVWRYPFKKIILETALIAFLLVFSFITKFNIGFCYLFVFGVLFLCLDKKIQIFSGALMGTTIATVILRMFFIPSFKVFYDQCFGLSATQTFRITNALHLATFFNNYYWIPGLIILTNTPFLFKKNKELLVLFFGLWFTGIFSTYTSNIVYESDVQVMGIYFTLAFWLITRLDVISMPSFLKLANPFFHKILTITVILLTLLYAKYGFQLKAWVFVDYVKTFPGMTVNPIGNYAMKNGPLKGWLCDEEKGAPVDQITDFFNQHVPKKQTLLVLTDLQILYPLTGKDSFRQMPWTYTIGFAPLNGPQRDHVQQYIMDHPPDWIVTHTKKICPIVNAMVPYLKLTNFINQLYIPVKKYGYYQVFVNRNLVKDYTKLKDYTG